MSDPTPDPTNPETSPGFYEGSLPAFDPEQASRVVVRSGLATIDDSLLVSVVLSGGDQLHPVASEVERAIHPAVEADQPGGQTAEQQNERYRRVGQQIADSLLWVSVRQGAAEATSLPDRTHRVVRLVGLMAVRDGGEPLTVVTQDRNGALGQLAASQVGFVFSQKVKSSGEA